MEERTLEIETKKTIRKVRNPRKVRKKDFIIFVAIQVMDNNGKWHHIANSDDIPYWKTDDAKKKIREAIKERKEYVKIKL